LLPLQALAWLRFFGRSYQPGVESLAELVSRIPVPKKSGEALSEEVRRLLSWIGQLREFAASVQDTRVVPEDNLKRLDDAVMAHGEEAGRFYEQGRAKTQSTAREFDKQHDAATDEATKLKLRVDRRQLPNYVSFPFDQAAQKILAELDQ